MFSASNPEMIFTINNMQWYPGLIPVFGLAFLLVLGASMFLMSGKKYGGLSIFWWLFLIFWLASFGLGEIATNAKEAYMSREKFVWPTDKRQADRFCGMLKNQSKNQDMPCFFYESFVHVADLGKGDVSFHIISAPVASVYAPYYFKDKIKQTDPAHADMIAYIMTDPNYDPISKQLRSSDRTLWGKFVIEFRNPTMSVFKRIE